MHINLYIIYALSQFPYFLFVVARGEVTLLQLVNRKYR